MFGVSSGLLPHELMEQISFLPTEGRESFAIDQMIDIRRGSILGTSREIDKSHVLLCHICLICSKEFSGMGLGTKECKVMKVANWVSKLIFLEWASDVCHPCSEIVLARNAIPNQVPKSWYTMRITFCYIYSWWKYCCFSYQNQSLRINPNGQPNSLYRCDTNSAIFPIGPC